MSDLDLRHPISRMFINFILIFRHFKKYKKLYAGFGRLVVVCWSVGECVCGNVSIMLGSCVVSVLVSGWFCVGHWC